MTAGLESLSSLPSPDCWNSLRHSLAAPTQTRPEEDFPDTRSFFMTVLQIVVIPELAEITKLDSPQDRLRLVESVKLITGRRWWESLPIFGVIFPTHDRSSHLESRLVSEAPLKTCPGDWSTSWCSSSSWSGISTPG